MPVDIEETPGWLTEDEYVEDELEDLLEDPFLDDDDRDSIETILSEM